MSRQQASVIGELLLCPRGSTGAFWRRWPVGLCEWSNSVRLLHIQWAIFTITLLYNKVATVWGHNLCALICCICHDVETLLWSGKSSVAIKEYVPIYTVAGVSPLCFYMEVLDNTEQLFACLWSRVIIMLTLVNKRFYKHWLWIVWNVYFVVTVW